MMKRYERDFLGYGPHFKVKLPNESHIAVQFVLNYEEGGENCLLHGDEGSEAFLSEIVGAQSWPAMRHHNMESIYEYGARRGFWRVHDLLTSYNVPVTIFGVTSALMRSPEQVHAMKEAQWEIASHALKWIEYKNFTYEQEQEYFQHSMELHKNIVGSYPKGWYTGRCSSNTLKIATNDFNFLYVSDSYADDLPYWVTFDNKNQLIMPYTLDSNDMRFATPQGFNSGEQFFQYLKDSFDILYEEGKNGNPKMLNIGLHCRLIGRPGRLASLKKFIEYIQSHDKVWIATREDIASYWHECYPYQQAKYEPYLMGKNQFMEIFGTIFPASWIAEKAFEHEISPSQNSAVGMQHLLCFMFRSATKEQKTEILQAYSDVIDHQTDEFYRLQEQYQQTFNFPFIIAVDKQHHADTNIVEQLKKRLRNDQQQEFLHACTELEKISFARLKNILPTYS